MSARTAVKVIDRLPPRVHYGDSLMEGSVVDFPQLVTEAEAAEMLGVPVEIIALWAREGRLLAAARTEGGQLVFYRWRVERDGASLAESAPIRTSR